MSTEVTQTIFDKIKALPPEQQSEVLSFIESLTTQREPAQKTIGEEVREITSDVPDEVWEQLPRDGSLNVDHYLYGAPKK